MAKLLMMALIGLVLLSVGCQSTNCPSGGCSQFVAAAVSLCSFQHSFLVWPGFWQCQHLPWNLGRRAGVLASLGGMEVALLWVGVAALPWVGPFLHVFPLLRSMGTLKEVHYRLRIQVIFSFSSKFFEQGNVLIHVIVLEIDIFDLCFGVLLPLGVEEVFIESAEEIVPWYDIIMLASDPVHHL